MKKPILSICIPTYNNAHVLKDTIENIVSKKVFNESSQIEIVVSDNCSEDDTEEVCRYYAENYPGKFVYSRNESNLKDLNFGISLSKATGEIRKLHNNYFHFIDGALEVILKLVEINRKEKPVIFLANGFETHQKESIFNCNDFNEFIQYVSFQSTWIGGFFIWEDDFVSAEDFSIYAHKSLAQTEKLFRILSNRKKSVIINEQIIVSHRSWPRGGYNIAEIFATNYIYLLNKYLTDGSLSPDVFEMAKKRVLLEHILPYLMSSNHDFKNDKILPFLSEYQWNDYFYMAMLQVIKSSKNSK